MTVNDLSFVFVMMFVLFLWVIFMKFFISCKYLESYWVMSVLNALILFALCATKVHCGQESPTCPRKGKWSIAYIWAASVQVNEEDYQAVWLGIKQVSSLMCLLIMKQLMRQVALMWIVLWCIVDLVNFPLGKTMI